MRKIKHLTTDFNLEQKEFENTEKPLNLNLFEQASFDIGFRILLPLILFLLIAKKMDKYLGTNNFWTLVGIICGCCFIFVAMVKLTKDK